MLGIPILHIARATAEAIAATGICKVALMGVRKTMEADFYSRVFDEYHIETMIPSQEDRRLIDNAIMSEMVRGLFAPLTKATLLEVANKLERDGAEGVVLGCTELPLLITARDTPVRLFSTTDIHCDAIVDTALSVRRVNTARRMSSACQRAKLVENACLSDRSGKTAWSWRERRGSIN